MLLALDDDTTLITYHERQHRHDAAEGSAHDAHVPLLPLCHAASLQTPLQPRVTYRSPPASACPTASIKDEEYFPFLGVFPELPRFEAPRLIDSGFLSLGPHSLPRQFGNRSAAFSGCQRRDA